MFKTICSLGTVACLLGVTLPAAAQDRWSTNSYLNVFHGSLPQQPLGFKFGSNVNSVSVSSTEATYRNKLGESLFDVGVLSSPSTPNSGIGLRANAAVLVNEGVALGVNALWTSQVRDYVVNFLWAPHNTDVVLRASASRLSGSQLFNFPSGSSAAALSQVGHMIGVNYLPRAETVPFLHSIGFSDWRAEAEQTGGSVPTYFVRESLESYKVLLDPKKLATGTLRGSAFDTQIEITPKLFSRIALGSESVVFPFAAGFEERTRRTFQYALLQFRPYESLTYQIDYRAGSSERTVSAAIGFRQFVFTAFSNRRADHQPQTNGFLVSYTIPLGQQFRSSPVNALTRPKKYSLDDYLLRQAARRPAQLPRTFLAKVDQTTVRTVATIDRSGLPADASITTTGDILLTVGVGGGSIVSVARNGQAFGSSSAIELSGMQLALRARYLPAPIDTGDRYQISLVDSSGMPYTVTMTAIR